MKTVNSPDRASFTSRMTVRESVVALCYLPVHLVLLPTLLQYLPETASLSELSLNIIVYVTGSLFMLIFAGPFLRRDFDPLCDHPFFCVLQVLICYGMMMAFNMLLSGLFLLFLPDSANPNNTAVMEMAGNEQGKIMALAVFLAPLVEEPIFRGAIFGLLYDRSRVLAIGVSMLLFSLYHVWGYALLDPANLIYLLQYLPVSWLLCRCYERCDSIWGSILLHMFVNYISLAALSSLQGMM